MVYTELEIVRTSDTPYDFDFEIFGMMAEDYE